MSPRQSRLWDALLPAAQGLLARNGEFFPIAAKIDTHGALTHSMAHEEGKEWSPSTTLLQILRKEFSKEAVEKRIVACAVAYDSRIRLDENSTGDAIVVELEDPANGCLFVFVPYDKLGKKITYHHPRAALSSLSIFKSEIPDLH
jgi:hypothetical protein